MRFIWAFEHYRLFSLKTEPSLIFPPVSQAIAHFSLSPYFFRGENILYSTAVRLKRRRFHYTHRICYLFLRPRPRKFLIYVIQPFDSRTFPCADSCSKDCSSPSRGIRIISRNISAKRTVRNSHETEPAFVPSDLAILR